MDEILEASPIEVQPDYENISPDTFEEFEAAHLEYIREEQLGERIRPAISTADFLKRPAPNVKSYVDGFVYAGAVNLIGGEPKAGKTILALHLCNAIAQGEPFLDQRTRQAKVLYITEQNELSFREELESIPGLKENKNLYLILPELEPMGVKGWMARIEFWREKIKALDAGVLVLDTFGAYSELMMGGENDAPTVSSRIMTLKALYAERPSLAIILIHHVRKPAVSQFTGRAISDDFANLRDVRGSTAIVGSVDHCVMLTKHKNKELSRVRGIHLEGRFTKEKRLWLELDAKNKYYQYSEG